MRKWPCHIFILFFIAIGTSALNAQFVTTLAGSGKWAYAGGLGKSASFKSPRGVAVDDQGNVYIGDSSNHSIRKIDPAGNVTTLAGSGLPGNAEGLGSGAVFNNPRGVAVDKLGNVYVVDHINNRICKVDPSGNVTTVAGSGSYSFADGQGKAAGFAWPTALAVDSNGNIYVGDSNNNRIRKITPNGNVTTLAGSGMIGHADGLGAAASFSNPSGVAVHSNGNIYVADSYNHMIRKVTPSGVVSTLAGSPSPGYADGNGATARFDTPTYLVVDASGNIYVSDSKNNRIRKVTPAGNVTTLAGSGTAGSVDGNGTAATFNYPRGLALDRKGYLYVSDSNSNRVRKISLESRICVLSGNLSFPALTVNQTSNRTLSIQNTGTGNLTVAGITCPIGFSGNWSGTIAPGATQNVTLTFAPLAVKNYGGNLTIHCDATSGATTLAIGGIGVPSAPVIISPLSANMTLGAAFSYQITTSNNATTYTASGLPAGLSLNATTGLIRGTPPRWHSPFRTVGSSA